MLQLQILEIESSKINEHRYELRDEPFEST